MAKKNAKKKSKPARVPSVTVRQEALEETMRVRVIGAPFDVREFERRLRIGKSYLMTTPYDPLEFGAESNVLYSEEGGKRVDILFVKVEGAGPNGEAEIWARRS